jgi:hypothetical protein
MTTLYYQIKGVVRSKNLFVKHAFNERTMKEKKKISQKLKRKRQFDELVTEKEPL